MHGMGHIAISNFRVCRDVSLPLGSFTPLVGQNNCGKSTILDAIKHVLAPKALSTKDATDPTQPIVVSARIDGITAELLDLLPEAKHRAAISPYCVNGSLWIRVTGPGKSKQEVWEPEQAFDGDVPTAWRAYPTGLPEAVSALMPAAKYILAMDDVGEDIGKGKAETTIRSLLDDVMAPILEAHAEVAEALASVRRLLASNGENRSPLLRQFDQDATDALTDFFPGLMVDMDVPTIEVKEFFRSGDIHVTDQMTGDRRKFDQLGSGAQRALQMALVRLLADRNHRNGRGMARRMLLIDEPELFLHPQAVVCLRESLDRLSQNGYQVIFATHSPMMVSSGNAADTVIVRRVEGTTAVRKPLRAAVQQALQDAPAQAHVLFQLGNIAEIFFSEKVVVCEGKTERRILPILLHKFRQQTDPSMCFVELGGCASITKGIRVLDAMEVPCSSIADLDFGFTYARSGNYAWLPQDDAPMTAARGLLQRMAADHGFQLNGGGLPQKGGGWTPEEIWSLFAKDAEGKGVAQGVHDSLRQRNAWVWPIGSMEDALGIDNKGEDAILEQEERLRGMEAEAIATELPSIKAFMGWLLDRQPAPQPRVEAA